MNTEIMKTGKGEIAVIGKIENPISNSSDFLDLLAGAGSETIAIKKEHLVDDFYDLSTGLAGEILQKISNYRKRFIIIGDFSSVTRKSLRDFIYESNKTGKVLFVNDIDEGIGKLR